MQGKLESAKSWCTFPFRPGIGRTKVSLHPGQENVSLLDGFVERGDGEGGSGVSGWAWLHGRQDEGSQALQPRLIRLFPIFRGVCGGPCDAAVVNALS